jgi:hypothetical protein
MKPPFSAERNCNGRSAGTVGGSEPVIIPVPLFSSSLQQHLISDRATLGRRRESGTYWLDIPDPNRPKIRIIH